MSSRGKALMAALAAVTALVLTACGGGGGQPTSTGSAPNPSGSQAAQSYVDFAEPQNGATVSSPVTVKMKAEGITIEPAGVVRPGAGHFHVMIDTPCPAAGQVIPADDTHKHYGKGQTEATLELTPGQHTLCLQAADGAHTALAPTKTITITVR
ncbi:MAG: DUF4399 domain-containing protein [Egibacteraceae bacterium]